MIFDAFERWNTHAYKFLFGDEHGIAIRSYAHLQMYSGDQSWLPMFAEQIDRFLEHALPDEVSKEAIDKFRNLQENPPKERNAAAIPIDALNVDQSLPLFYEFDFGDSWEPHIESENIKEGLLNGEPVVVDEQDDIPPQHLDRMSE